MIISNLSMTKSSIRDVEGNCAKCNTKLYESLFLLDDAYNVWAGKCPHCMAINMLSMNHGLRGYSSKSMWLVLPTDEEVEMNTDLPCDCPTSGSHGPATAHGSPLGEFLHKLSGKQEESC